MKRFGEYVAAARKAKGLTLETVAGYIRSHKGYVSGIERGTVAPPSPKYVTRLCRRLDLPAAEMHALVLWEKRDPELVTVESMFALVAALKAEADQKLLPKAAV